MLRVHVGFDVGVIYKNLLLFVTGDMWGHVLFLSIGGMDAENSLLSVITLQHIKDASRVALPVVLKKGTDHLPKKNRADAVRPGVLHHQSQVAASNMC